MIDIRLSAADPYGRAGNPVASLHHPCPLAAMISTVDDVATRHGQLVRPWAVAGQLVGRTNHFGLGWGTPQPPQLSP